MLSDPLRNRALDSEWDETRSVEVFQEVPLKTVWRGGAGGLVRIAVDYRRFIGVYAEQFTSDDAVNTRLLKVIQQRACATDSIDIDALLTELGMAPPWQLEDVFNFFTDAGQVCLFDIQNGVYVERFTLHDEGYRVGPLFAQGRREYLLPDGRLFRSEEYRS